MAVIQKIRERYAKLAGAVIGLSLVAFIISEGVNGTFGNFFGNDTSVAKVNGEGIDGREFAQMTKDYISLSEVFRKGQRLSEQEQAQLRQQVLDQMIAEKMTEKECEKLGIQVSETEKKDMISGPNPDQTVQQYFTTLFQAQQFDPNMVKEFENQVKKGDDPKLAELGVQWEALKKFVVRARLNQKYAAMLAGSVYTPKAIVAENNKLANTMADIRFVKLPLTLIPDAQAPVTEADLKDYMNRHKAQFETDQPTRAIDYVTYDVLPGSDDTDKALGVLNKIKADFVSTTNNEAFVNRNSEERYTNTYVTKNTFMSPMSDTILHGSVGTVYGPYFDNGNYKMVKVIERRQIPDSVKAQHILIGIREGVTDTIAHQRADSLFAAIKAGANFDSLAAKFSDDGSKTQGGDLGYFPYGKMVPEFNEAAFLGTTGEIKEVKSQFGWHIIKINDQKGSSAAVKLATVTKALVIGAKANQMQFAKANEFAGRNRTGDAFDAAVKKEGLAKKVADAVKPGDYVIQGLGPSREIIRWAYAAKLGDISDPIALDNRYVVAKVAAVTEKGQKSLDAQTKTQLEGVVRAEKKAKMLADKYKGQQSLEAVAQAAGQTVQMADSISGTASFTQGIGYEPKVIGYAFDDKFQPNTVSPAIKGKDGVFFISVTHRNTVDKPTDAQSLKMQSSMQDSQTKNYLAQSIGESLRRRNTVKYNPQNIY